MLETQLPLYSVYITILSNKIIRNRILSPLLQRTNRTKVETISQFAILFSQPQVRICMRNHGRLRMKRSNTSRFFTLNITNEMEPHLTPPHTTIIIFLPVSTSLLRNIMKCQHFITVSGQKVGQEHPNVTGTLVQISRLNMEYILT